MIALVHLLVAVGALDVAKLPVNFAAAGAEVVVRVSAPEGAMLLLDAFGEKIGAPLAVVGGQVLVLAPQVRARTVVALVPESDAGCPAALLVVYPQDDQPWPPGKVELLACATPEWFEQWARAVGAPIRFFATEQELRRSTRGTADHRVIVLGEAAGIEDPGEAIALARTCGANALALAAPWFRSIPAVQATPKLDTVWQGLPQLAEWTWRPLPAFQGGAQPGMVWMNRTAIIRDDNHVWVELLRQPDEPHVLVASYLPWVQHLGRDDNVDALFAALLLETARAPIPERLEGRVVIHGGNSTWPDPHRPVLSRLPRTGGGDSAAPLLHIVDLRGLALTTVAAREIQALLDDANSAPVLMLGQDETLRSVRRLPEPGLPKKMPAEVIWLTDDESDATQEQQELLLRIVTAYNVPIQPLSENER